MQGLGGEALAGHQRAIVKAVDWMQKHDEPIDEKTWEGIWEIAQTAKRASVRLKAYAMFTNRFDPEPKAGDEFRGPVSISVAIVTTDRAGLPSQGNGVAIRIGRGNGDSA